MNRIPGNRYTHGDKTRHAARARRRATHVPDFIGVDGEGVTYPESSLDYTDADGNFYPGKRHEYVLLSVGSESFHKNGAPLHTYDIFSFLWDMYLENPHAVHAGFYLSYDFTMWFRDLPANRAAMLLSPYGIKQRERKIGRNSAPFPVQWEEWEFDLLDMRRFKLRRQGDSQWLWICDAGPFFQTSFLKAIDPKAWPTPILSDSEYETIKRGKESRSDAEFDPAMIKYNVLENEVFSRLMTVTHAGFREMDVKLKKNQWYGPGQAAQVWLNNINAPDKDIAKYHVPEFVLQAAQDSYYGGWFEIFIHGHIPGTVYEYDINSAYPAEIANLPCLEHGEWITDSDGDQSGAIIELVYADVSGLDAYIGTMPHRTKKGAILRPHRTCGWFWMHELNAAVNAGAVNTVIIEKRYRYVQHCSHRPFEAIRKLYEQRRVIGKNTAHGKALKLVYNSAYGKLAQSVGDPKYANPIYASLITAGVRKRIWDAIASHPNGTRDVTMIATDAVYFRSPHPSLPISSNIGDWDVASRKSMTQFMPGLYWDDSTRAGGSVKSRGVNATDLKAVIDIADERWLSKYTRLQADPTSCYPVLTETMGAQWVKGAWEAWPQVTVPIRFGLVSARLAMHRNDWSQCGAISTRPRFLSGDPTDKRAPDAYIEGDVIRTRPYESGPDGVVSTPYDKRFGLDYKRQIIEDDVITAEGRFDDELYEFVRNE